VRSSLTGVLPEALAILRDRYPHLGVRLNTGDSTSLAAMVAGGRLDVAIVPDSAAGAEGLSWHPFAVEPLMVIAPEGTRGSTDQEVLEAAPYIRFQRDVPIAHVITEEIERRGIRVAEEMQIAAFAAIVLMVVHGLGVSVVPRRATRRPLPDDIVSLPFGQPPIRRVIGLIEAGNNAKAQLVEALHQELWRLSGSPRLH
jgi:DNA-binding transcriptional LysR family regulator